MDIFTSVDAIPDATTAACFGRHLVGGSTVARVNVQPGLRSIYRSNDTLQAQREVLMTPETPAERPAADREQLVALHSHDVSEVVALPVADGHHPDLRWVADSTRIP